MRPTGTIMPLAGYQRVNLQNGADTIRRRRYGVIEVVDGREASVLFRPWPAIITWWDAVLIARWQHRWSPGDRCRLYFNQTHSCSRYLTLALIVSSRETSYRTMREALDALDLVARIKQSDAIVCEVTNNRISERILERWGWERHCLDQPRRHYIKRFYGTYPAFRREGCATQRPCALQNPGLIWRAGCR